MDAAEKSSEPVSQQRAKSALKRRAAPLELTIIIAADTDKISFCPDDVFAASSSSTFTKFGNAVSTSRSMYEGDGVPAPCHTCM